MNLKKLLTLLLAGTSIFGIASVSFAKDVTLAWDAVADTSVVGYKVYYQADSSAAPFTGTGATQGTSPINVATATSATISGLDPAKAYYFAVTAYDAAGNESTYSNVAFAPESLSPTVSISAPAANAAVGGTITLAAIAVDNIGVSKVEFYMDNGLVATTTSQPYSVNYATSSLTNGTHTLVAKAYDSAGNVGSSQPVQLTVSNDLTPPTVSVASPASGVTVSGSVTVSVNASDNVGVSVVSFFVNGSLQSSDPAAPYSLTWDTKAMSNGSHTIHAMAYDAAGNSTKSSTITVTVSNDATAPTVSITAPAANATVSGSATVTAIASDNVGITKVEFLVDDVLKTTDTTSPYSFTWDSKTASNGSHSLTARAYDAVGNATLSPAVAVTVANDITVPTASITAPTASAMVSGSVTVTAAATDNMGVTKVEFLVDGILKATDTSAPYSFSWDTQTANNGSYALTARAYDAAGNSTLSSSVSVTISNDVTAPVVTITSPTAGALVSGPIIVSGSASVTATATDNIGVTKVEFLVNGTLKSTDNSAPYAFFWDTTKVASGSSYTLTVTAYDVAGNSSSKSVTVTVDNSKVIRKKGDVNNDKVIDVNDAIIMLKQSSSTPPPTTDYLYYADVAPLSTASVPEGDGKVDVTDVLMVLRYAVGQLSW